MEKTERAKYPPIWLNSWSTGGNSADGVVMLKIVSGDMEAPIYMTEKQASEIAAGLMLSVQRNKRGEH